MNERQVDPSLSELDLMFHDDGSTVDRKQGVIYSVLTLNAIVRFSRKWCQMKGGDPIIPKMLTKPRTAAYSLRYEQNGDFRQNVKKHVK